MDAEAFNELYKSQEELAVNLKKEFDAKFPNAVSVSLKEELNAKLHASLEALDAVWKKRDEELADKLKKELDAKLNKQYEKLDMSTEAILDRIYGYGSSARCILSNVGEKKRLMNMIQHTLQIAPTSEIRAFCQAELAYLRNH